MQMDSSALMQSVFVQNWTYWYGLVQEEPDLKMMGNKKTFLSLAWWVRQVHVGVWRMAAPVALWCHKHTISLLWTR